MSYCSFVQNTPSGSPHRRYHDTQYGFPVSTDQKLFERLILEINQAGLSWHTILMKQKNFHLAYDKFNLKKVAAYGSKDIKRLMENKGIIRNQRKIEAAIHNANIILTLKKEHGSFRQWLETYQGQSLDLWVKLFRKTFVFVGKEIVNEFLMSTGYLPGAHQKDCPRYVRLKGSGSH